MTTRRLLIIVPTIICLAAVCIVGIFIYKNVNVTFPSVVCPDGSVVELVGVTHGKVHHNPITGPWARLIQVIPTPIRNQFNIQTPNLLTRDKDTLIVWLQWKGKGSNWNGNKEVVDLNGFTCEQNHWGNSGKKTTQNGIIHWLGIEITSYPRRDDSFKLRLKNWDRKVEAEFEIKNPSISNEKPFKGTELPSNATVDDIQFNLISLQLPDPENPPQNRELSFNSHDARATFEIIQNEQANEDWQAVNIWLEDATGNKTKNHSWSNREQDGKVSITFDSGLFPGEAWKVRTQFARKQNYLPEDIWSVEIPLPNASDYQTNLVSRVMHGKTVKVLGIADKNGLLLDGSKAESSRNSNPKRKSFEIRVEDMPEELRLDLFEVSDDKGRDIKTGGKSWGGGHYRYTIELEDDATRLNVKLAVHQSKFADYIAEPSIVSEEPSEN